MLVPAAIGLVGTELLTNDPGAAPELPIPVELDAPPSELAPTEPELPPTPELPEP